MVNTSRRLSGQEDCSEENDLFSSIIGRPKLFIQFIIRAIGFFRVIGDTLTIRTIPPIPPTVHCRWPQRVVNARPTHWKASRVWR